MDEPLAPEAAKRLVRESNERRTSMKCIECGATMKVRKENYRYDESGLKHVTLVGVDVARCPRCDNYEISIPHIEELHRLIAKILIDKSTRFTGEEVRFLRK